MFVRSQCSSVLSFLSFLVFRPFLVSFRSQFPYVRSVRKLRREANPPNTRVGMIWGCLEKDLFEVTIQNYCSMQLGVSATLFLLRSSSSDMQRNEKVASVDASHQPGAPRVGANAQASASPIPLEPSAPTEKGKRKEGNNRGAASTAARISETTNYWKPAAEQPWLGSRSVSRPPAGWKACELCSPQQRKEWRSNRRANASLAQAGYAGVCG